MTITEPDVVGAAEAAEILGVVTPQITRWKKGERMPAPAAELAATTVWHRADIEAMRDGTERDPGERLDLIGTSEAAEILSVDKSQIGRWRRSDGTEFPEPCKQLRAGPLWWGTQVRDFATARAA